MLLAPGRIYVLDIASGGSADLNGINEFVSTDGGASFTLEPHAVGFVGGDSGPAGPAIELPGGDFGAGYVIPGSNPAFQANSLAAPTDQSGATTPPFATLNPQPANAYSFEQVGGAFGSRAGRIDWRARRVRRICGQEQLTLPVERERVPGSTAALRPDRYFDDTGRALHLARRLEPVAPSRQGRLLRG